MWDNTAVGDITLYVEELHFSRSITLYVEDKGRGVITLYLDIYLCRKRNTIKYVSRNGYLEIDCYTYIQRVSCPWQENRYM
jgi:hypothetical protein